MIISGCSEYNNLEDLPAVRNNIVKLLEVFTHPLIGGLNSAAIRVLDQPGSPGELLDSIYDSAAECTDTLIYYYAGHGLTSFPSGDLFLALPGSDATRPHTSVRFDDVRHAVLSARRAPRKIVILDCCFSGRAMSGTMANADDFAARSDIQGTYIMTAAAETKTALAPPGEQYTAFTGELLKVLSEGIPDSSKALSLDRIYDVLHSRLAAKSRPIPQQRNRNAGSKILLVRNAGYRPSVATNGSMEHVLQYVQDKVNASVDPELLRSKMNSLHLPYSDRLNSARMLALYDKSLAAECCEVIDKILSAPDVGDLDSVKAIEIVAKLDSTRLDWAHEVLANIAARPIGASRYTPIVREHASDVLDRIGLREAAIFGYTSLLEDRHVSLARRALAAESMASAFPESREIAIAFMWRVAKDEKVNIKDRLDVLRKICVISPEDIPAASTWIEDITSAGAREVSES